MLAMFLLNFTVLKASQLGEIRTWKEKEASSLQCLVSQCVVSAYVSKLECFRIKTAVSMRKAGCRKVRLPSLVS